MISDQTLFTLANIAPLPAWLGLAAAPLGRGLAVGFARGVASVLAGGYVVLIATALANPHGPTPDLSSLAGLAQAFSDPHGTLIGWVHFLCLDLWTGAWIIADAGTERVRHWAVVPCLALAFLAGPAGLLVYLALRRVAARRAGA